MREAGTSCSPRVRELIGVAAVVLALKVYSVALLYGLSLQVDVRPDYAAFLYLADGETRSDRLEEIQSSFIERLAPYDGQFYLDVARKGYRRLGARERRGPEGNYAFFPLLPLLERGASSVSGGSGMGVVLLLNALLSTGGAVGVYALARRVEVPAWSSVLFLLTFPTAMFQSALYTESLFLFLSVGAALAVTCARPWRGTGLSYLAGLCRPQGILVAALWTGRVFRRGVGRRSGLRLDAGGCMGALAAPAALATFSLGLWAALGEPLGFVEIQQSWGRDFRAAGLLRQVFEPGGYSGPPFDLLALLFGVGLVPFLWRTLPRSLALFGTLSVALPLATGSPLSFGRFISVSFPHFLCLAKVFETWPLARHVLMGGFILLQCLLAKALIGWSFVG